MPALNVDLSLSDARYILSTAIESSIAYWMNVDATNVEVHRSPNWTDSCEIEDVYYTGVEFDAAIMSDEVVHYNITPELMVEKFVPFLEYCRNNNMGWRFGDWMKAYADEDLGAMDAVEADVFFQWLCFGEIVFG